MWLEVPLSANTCRVPVGAGNVGSVQGMTVTFNPVNRDAVFTASYTWVSSTHLQVKITASTGLATATVTNAAGKYVPTASLGIASTNLSGGGAANICVTVAARCNPTATGGF
jgi:hypothetical protein